MSKYNIFLHRSAFGSGLMGSEKLTSLNARGALLCWRLRYLGSLRWWSLRWWSLRRWSLRWWSLRWWSLRWYLGSLRCISSTWRFTWWWLGWRCWHTNAILLITVCGANAHAVLHDLAIWADWRRWRMARLAIFAVIFLAVGAAYEAHSFITSKVMPFTTAIERGIFGSYQILTSKTTDHKLLIPRECQLKTLRFVASQRRFDSRTRSLLEEHFCAWITYVSSRNMHDIFEQNLTVLANASILV
ncbi:hypothetical protein E6O75_ATG06461 [Venturia nashicola]|uniref:Uncharacterized protein n=1 Tax=Venturia nashicola TaxID=86259 RepID=A0A4Z1P340_9PEZI|nr:hypothetical protein E6O75_ATG06461 [Venturia nashicola]